MKANMMTPITAMLLLCLLLILVACEYPGSNLPTGTQAPVSSGTTSPEKDTSPVPGTDESTLPDISETETHPQVDSGTDLPIYPGDIEIDLPELQETAQIILSVKNGQILGATSLDKPENTDIIDSFNAFESLYGTVEGIDEAFFEVYALRLVYTAQSSGSTRYAVESITVTEGKLHVEIIEQHAAISTRDLRHWFVFAAVEKGQIDVPVEVNVTGIQLTE